VRYLADGKQTSVRYCLLGGLLVLEGVILGIRFDATAIATVGRPWWNQLLSYASIVPQLAIAMATAAVLLGGERLVAQLRRARGPFDASRRTWPFWAGHLAALTAFTLLTRAIFEGTASGSPAILAAWLLSGLAVPALLVAVALPTSLVLVIVRATRRLLLLAVFVGAAAWGAGSLTAILWEPMRNGTMAGVHALLSLFAADTLINPGEFVVGTERFSVTIAPPCSGYQGIGMIWVFLGVYLWMFRDVLRFPRALLLIPVATVTVWLANIARITALLVVGSSLSPAIARGGFHSYVGSLLFSAIALSLAWACHRSTFFLKAHVDAGAQGHYAHVAVRDDPTVGYLLPMLAVLATALVAGVVSTGEIDLLYPLRFFAVAGCLWVFRRVYRELHWTWSWHAVAAGVAVFVMWLALEPARAEAQATALPAPLGTLPAGLAFAWLAFRVLGSTLTVPLAEELAFRGYITRRLSSVDFQSLPLRRITWVGLAVSSLLFGAMHARLVAGTLAGLAYGLVARRRGELSDAVLAHATTNALLAAYVLATGSWALWG